MAGAKTLRRPSKANSLDLPAPNMTHTPTTPSPVIQCVPNFSEGRSRATLDAIVDSARAASTARIIDYSLDPDHNRAVVTLLGAPGEIRDAVLAAAHKAIETIDLRHHDGEHPRIGAVDVIPLVPIAGITLQECAEIACEIGQELSHRLDLPIYFYEHSARCEHRANLPDVRRGGFERLCELGMTGDRAPDCGPSAPHPSAGATVVGARNPLIAYNVNLRTTDLEIAREIVRSIRSGEADLTGVRSIAVWLASRSLVQVSTNITRPDLSSIQQVFTYVSEQAEKLGVAVAESEIIGAIRRRHLDGATPERIKAVSFKEEQIIDNWL